MTAEQHFVGYSHEDKEWKKRRWLSRVPLSVTASSVSSSDPSLPKSRMLRSE